MKNPERRSVTAGCLEEKERRHVWWPRLLHRLTTLKPKLPHPLATSHWPESSHLDAPCGDLVIYPNSRTKVNLASKVLARGWGGGCLSQTIWPHWKGCVRLDAKILMAACPSGAAAASRWSRGEGLRRRHAVDSTALIIHQQPDQVSARG